ncbi:MAG: tripartite tricarboxylate transporter permease [Theionarchaea archaeon]|nr:tripartite tricarboxylate transporter permease [Theionarchaea archaeon]
MNESLLLIGYCVAGCLCGILTGLIPGIHVNTLLPFLLLFPDSGIHGAVLIFSLALCHTYVDFIPSTLLGVPDADTVLSILPGHRLLLAGRGYEAVKLTVIGSFGAFICSCIAFFPLSLMLSNLYWIISPLIPFIILFFIGYSIVSERTGRKIGYAIFVSFLAGIYGHITLSGSFLPDDIILFPIFGGLYGLSTLMLSVKTCGTIPSQRLDGTLQVNRASLLCSVIKGGIAGICVAVFPGIGPSHGATVVSSRSSPRHFLLSVSGVNTANVIFGLAVLYMLGKSRSGAILAIQDLIHCDPHMIKLLLSSSCIVSGIAVISTLVLAQVVIRMITRIKYRYITLISSSIIIFTVGILTGITGLLILGIGCIIGLLPVLLGIRRIHCMSVLLFPILIYYFNIVV